jgi:hypothetical protein
MNERLERPVYYKMVKQYKRCDVEETQESPVYYKMAKQHKRWDVDRRDKRKTGVLQNDRTIQEVGNVVDGRDTRKIRVCMTA